MVKFLYYQPKMEIFMVTLKTSLGSIVIELDPEKAPITVANFLSYCKKGYYNGTIFHRVIKGFMIQGGGLTGDLENKKGQLDPIKNEADNGLSNLKYTIAMARTSDPHSATSQFFINTKDNKFLDHTARDLRGWGYCVFGRVVSGQDVVDKIEAVKTARSGIYSDVPVTPIEILQVEAD